MNSDLLNIARNSSVLFASQLLAYFIAFIFNLVVANYLGPEIYGDFIFVFSTLSLFTILIQLGNKNGLMFYIPRLKEDKSNFRDLISTTIVFSGLLGILIVIINFTFMSSIISIYILGDSIHTFAVKVITVIVFFEAISEILKAAIRGNNEIKHFALGGVLVHAIRLLLMVIFILFEIKTNTLLISYLLTSVIILIYYLIVLKAKRLFGTIDSKSIKLYFAMLMLFLPTMFTSVVSVLSTQVDKIMIGNLIDSYSVGIYNIALVIANLSIFVFSIINLVISPVISKVYYKNDKEKLKEIYKVVTKWSLNASLLFFALILLVHDDLLSLFGDAYILGSVALILVSIGQLFNALSGPSVAIINMSGNTKISFFFSLISLVLNIILNFIFIPRFGINGAAFTTALSLLILSVLNISYIFYKFKMLPFSLKTFKLSGLIAITFFITLLLDLFLPQEGIIHIVGIIFVFTIALFLISLRWNFDKEDKEILEIIRKKIR